MDIQKILTGLKLDKIETGASTGSNWWSDKKGSKLKSFNPTTEECISEIYQADEKDYEQIVKKSSETFKTWRMVPAPVRGDLIRHMGDALRMKKDLLGSLVALEASKSKQEGDGEVQEMIDMADFAVGQSRMLYGKVMQSERLEHRMIEQWHPLGVVGVISAYNFPVAVWAWNAFIAAICGNTVIWRPSSKTPLCALAVQQICNEVMEKNGYDGIFSTFVSEDLGLSNKLVADTRIPLISFTGSTNVGRRVAQTIAGRMGKAILECSGNNAMIIDETADLEKAIPTIVFGAVGTAGQRCTSTRRAIIHESIFDKVVNSLVNAYGKIRIGDPLDQNNHMGPLIDGKSVDLYEKAIVKAKNEGGEVLFGGKAIAGKGHFVQPTIIRAENHWEIVQEETFAPILYVMPYKDLDEAIAMQNGVAQGLSSAILTSDLRRAERFLSAKGSDCGIANVNIGTSGAEIGGAFGGEKDTGGGREAGSDSWKAYMRRQTVTINWSDELPLAQGIKFEI